MVNAVSPGIETNNMNINESNWQYISAHSEDDVSQLALHPSKDPQVDMAVALQQIAGR